MATALILIGCASGKAASISQAAQHLVERVAAGQLVEAVALQRVDRDVEAVDAGRHQPLGVALEQEAVGGDRDLARHRRSAEHRGQAREVPADERLAAGQAHVGRPSRRTDPPARAISSKVRISAALQPGQALGGHAVLAAEVAAVGDRDPQIADQATVTVPQRLCTPSPRG